MNESLVIRMGKAQIILEDVFRDRPPQTTAEVVTAVLRVSTRYSLPFRCYRLVEDWALQRYGGES